LRRLQKVVAPSGILVGFSLLFAEVEFLGVFLAVCANLAVVVPELED
jgi:hypothetical protein